MIICTSSLVYDCCKRNGIAVAKAYTKDSFLYRQVRKYCKNEMILEKNVFNKELTQIDDDWIVVFDACITQVFLKWLQKMNPSKKLNFFYWNPVENSIDVKLIPHQYRIWTYSREEAMKYSLNFASTFFAGDYKVFTKSKKKFDAIFIGADKGRIKNVKKIAGQLRKHNLSTYLHFTPDKWWKLLFNSEYKKPIPYLKIIDYVKSSTAIIDYYTDVNSGLSQRMMEAIFYEKKLITNNHIVKKEPFYCKNNIFITDMDYWGDIEEFITTDINKVSQLTKQQFTMQNWVQQFYCN